MNILLTFVGQTREFLQVKDSHIAFAKNLSANANVYVSYVIWDKSYVPIHGMKCFVQNGITSNTILGQIDMPFVKQLTVDVLIYDEVAQEMCRIFGEGNKEMFVDEYNYIACIYDKALERMLDIEREQDIRFDAVISTRPDIFVYSDEPVIIAPDTVSPSTLYFNGPDIVVSRRAFGDGTPVSISYIMDSFMLFGRAAFIAFGLMYRFIVAGHVSGCKSPLIKPGPHRWNRQQLNKFNIGVGNLLLLMSSVKYMVVRHNVIGKKAEGPSITQQLELFKKLDDMWADYVTADPINLRLALDAFNIKYEIV